MYNYGYTCMLTSPLQMISCDFGEIKLSCLTVLLLALNILEIRFVLVNKAAYTTVKQNPVPKLNEEEKSCVQSILFVLYALQHNILM